MLVFADLVIFLGLLEGFHSVATHIAHRYLALLGIFVRELYQFLAPLLVQLWNGNTQKLPVDLRIEPKSRVANGFVGGLHKSLVPHLYSKESWLGRAHRADLSNGHLAAVGLDFDRIE